MKKITIETFKKHKKRIAIWTTIVFVFILFSFIFKNGINTVIADTVELKSKAFHFLRSREHIRSSSSFFVSGVGIRPEMCGMVSFDTMNEMRYSRRSVANERRNCRTFKL